MSVGAITSSKDLSNILSKDEPFLGYDYEELVSIMKEPTPLPTDKTPHRSGSKRKMYSFSLDEESVKIVDKLSSELKCSKDSIVTFFIKQFIKEVALIQLEKRVEKDLARDKTNLKKAIKELAALKDLDDIGKD